MNEIEKGIEALNENHYLIDLNNLPTAIYWCRYLNGFSIFSFCHLYITTD